MTAEVTFAFARLSVVKVSQGAAANAVPWTNAARRTDPKEILGFMGRTIAEFQGRWPISCVTISRHGTNGFHSRRTYRDPRIQRRFSRHYVLEISRQRSGNQARRATHRARIANGPVCL